jgi:hypothetical protein
VKLTGRALQTPAPRFDAAHGGGDPRWIYLSTEEACTFLGYVGRWRLRSLYRWVEANGVPKFYRSPRRLRLRLSDLLAVLKRGGCSHGVNPAASVVSAEAVER